MRDAIPGHEIDRIVARMKAGESLRHDIYPSLKTTIADIWFERNAESLYKLAGVDPASDEREDLDDVLDEPEPTEAKVAAEVEHEGEPLSEAERAAAREELAKLEEQARAADPAPEQKGKKHRK